MPDKPIISDTSCFIILSNIGELELLHKVYGQVATTMEVAAEFGQDLPSWIEIKAARDKHLQQVLEMQIDKGKASAIALAIETQGSTLILDDYKARKIATSLGLSITGTLGVIIKAKLQKVIPTIKPIIDKMKKTNFRLAVEIEKQALKEAGE